MWNRIFPKIVDNTYRGHWMGIAALVVVLFLKGAQGVTVLVNTHDTLIGADGIPVDTFADNAAATALGLFALLGMSHLIVPFFGLVALVRWRALVPLVLLMSILVQLGSRLVQTVFPIPRAPAEGLGFAGQPIGFYVNLGILVVTIIGFVLSLTQRRGQAALAQGAH